jgi:cystathionine beta-lyase
MSFDFDTVPDRRNTDSLKWSRHRGRDIIPMWVADMDFRAPEPVLEALRGRVEHGVFGYAVPPKELLQVVVERMEQKYQWKIEPSWIVWMPGVVPALNVACRAFGDDGDEVLAFTPIYPPFLSAPPLSGRTLKTIPLRRDGGRYTLDAEMLAREVSPRSRVLLLCNPHNPVGRRYGSQELRAVAEVCVARDIILCSDEVHCDLILDGGRHVPTATLSREIAARTITLMAPSKTFNIPGLHCAFAIIPHERLRRGFQKAREGIVPGPGAMGYAACLAAYRDCEPWRLALIDYLRDNKELVHRFVNERSPTLSMDDVEATYLAWIDVRNLGVPDPARFFENSGVALSDGLDFDGPGHLRLNFGCTRGILREALDRLGRGMTRR